MVLAPTQSCALRKTLAAHKIPPSSSCSFNQTLPLWDSATAYFTRTDEDATLCYADSARPSECDLTACASAPSALNIHAKLKGATTLPPSLTLVFPQLPEIPDWYDNDDARPQPLEMNIPLFDTPPSEYQSLEDYHPEALCCVDILSELDRATAHVQHQYQSPREQVAFGFLSPALSTPGKHNYKHVPGSLPPPMTITDALSLGNERPRIVQHRRRYSLDSADRRPVELSGVVPPNAGLGFGLGSPFFQAPAHHDDLSRGEADSSDAYLHTHPKGLFTSPELVHVYADSPPERRRREALTVWRPRAPSPHSLPQPFPSSASLYALDAPTLTRGRGLPSSVSWPAVARGRRITNTKTKGIYLWTLEEQITIAVLAAMEARDMENYAPAQSQACQGSAGARGVAGRGAGSGGRKGRIRRLVERIWRKEGMGAW
ncbi:hypothetical protein GGX14DRAFT_441825 [Mycena pura]|uniref:Uncharacterized protein n=1 Tax=Mycena pura TaxID=153505 RepID=A0AAD6YJS4_9AGAR|nr:hypothetical protein GGX14DRAFT_441825 [Mycena pura]